MDELPQLELDGGEWYRAVPPPAIPIPAANMPIDLHGQRAIASVPEVGVIHDLRILGDAQHEGGQRWVHLLPEVDYWRTIVAPGRPAAPQRYPLDRVFIEHRLPVDLDAAQPANAGDAAALLRRLTPQPHLPGARTPVPARTVPHLHGRRVIQVNPLGFSWDLRAVSDPYQTDTGDILVNLTSSEEYHRWILTSTLPQVVPIGLYLLWVE